KPLTRRLRSVVDLSPQSRGEVFAGFLANVAWMSKLNTAASDEDKPIHTSPRLCGERSRRFAAGEGSLLLPHRPLFRVIPLRIRGTSAGVPPLLRNENGGRRAVGLPTARHSDGQSSHFMYR